MKSYFLLLAFGCIHLWADAQNTRKAVPGKKTGVNAGLKKVAHPPATPSGHSGISPAIDSFKRSSRYSPGRPYEALNDTIRNNTLVDATTKGNNVQVATTATPATSIRGYQPPVLSGHMSQQVVPTSTGVDRNHADVNQRQINVNSTNATTDINRVQMNALNNNQLAPPPENMSNGMAPNTWGRNTLGESQWTPSPSISAGFSKDYPEVTDITWMRDARDTSNFSVRYRNGNWWSVSTYSGAGARLDTRTQLDFDDLPRPVSFFIERHFVNTHPQKVVRVERPYKIDFYELRFSAGRVVYIDGDGREIGLDDL